MAFQYRIRSKEQWEARTHQSNGDFEGFLKDEYRIYKPASGENCVRILPPSPKWTDAQHYGIEVWVHYSVGPDRAAVICLFRMKKGNCPICEERARAERAKDVDRARELRPAKRVLVFMLNQKDPAQGPMAWGMPKTLDEAITKVAKDRATGEFFFVDDPEKGYDVYFDKDGEQLNTKYSGCALAKRPTAVPAQVLEWVEDHVLPDALRWRDYNEVNRLFIGAGRGEAPDESPTGPAEGPRVVSMSSRRPEARPEPSERPTRSERSQPQRDEPEPPTQRAAPQDEDGGPPFDTDPPHNGGDDPGGSKATAPSSNGGDRAAQLRAKFNLK